MASDLIIGHDEGGFYTDSGYVSDEQAAEQGYEAAETADV